MATGNTGLFLPMYRYQVINTMSYTPQALVTNQMSGNVTQHIIIFYIQYLQKLCRTKARQSY